MVCFNKLKCQREFTVEAEVHGSNFRNSLKFQKALVRWGRVGRGERNKCH